MADGVPDTLGAPRTLPRRQRVRRAPPGNIRSLQRELWHGIKRCGDILDDEDAEAQDVMRAVNAISVAANAYLRALEAGDLHDQVQTLWEAHQAQNPGRRAA